MVKGIRVLALAAAALACLVGCNLSTSIFPDRLMGYEAYADLSGHIDHDHIWDYNFQIIRDSSSGAEYLVLAANDDSFGDDCVVIFDADLKVLGHYTLDELDAMDTANPFNGRGAMVDKSGCIVVGNRRFTVAARSVTYLGTPGLTLHHYGLAIPDAPDPNLGNIRGDGSNLRFDRYSASWVYIATMTMSLGASPWHEVVGAWLTATDVLLVVRHDPDPDIAHVLKMNDLMFATGGLTPPLLAGSYANTVPSQNDIEWRTLGYTNEGFAAFRWTSNQYFLFDEWGNPTGVTLDVPDEKNRPYNQYHLYGRTAGWYIFDLKEMSIERRKWWWK